MDEFKLQDETSASIRLICVYCERFLNNEGYWEHTHDTSFPEMTSHGMCPKCLKEQFPDEYSSLVQEGFENITPRGREQQMENRKCPRVAMKNITVEVSDGVGVFSGNVPNLSRSGLYITDLPKKVNEAAKIMTVVVSGHRQFFKMNVKPKWSTTDNLTKCIGVQIVNISVDWTKFIMRIEPVFPDDLWRGYKFLLAAL